MLLVIAAMIAAPVAAQKGPWLEMQAGPMMLHEGGRSGMGTGPMMRFDAGMAVSERFAGELWLQGSLENAPLSAPGDRALIGGGLAGRYLVRGFGAEQKLTLWARGGAGWMAADGLDGPTAFGGMALMFQPFVQRFTIGLEADAMGGKNAIGFALLPSLRCAL